GIVEIGPNDTLGAPRNLDVIKPARFARNYPVFAGLQLSNAPGTGSHLTLLAPDQNPMETKVTCLYARSGKINS
ncbi:hypothetical protein, partial [Acetobacter sicerae]|uniref:hypothetical protein n=1 Tax=Acetobacter sicerae TaxID=85325 RepID=UPI001A7E4607